MFGSCTSYTSEVINIMVQKSQPEMPRWDRLFIAHSLPLKAMMITFELQVVFSIRTHETEDCPKK